MPPFLRIAGNLAHAVADVVHARMRGQPVMIDDAEAERRLRVCSACREWYDATRDRCAHPACGCYLRIKTRLRAMRCPDGRW